MMLRLPILEKFLLWTLVIYLSQHTIYSIKTLAIHNSQKPNSFPESSNSNTSYIIQSQSKALPELQVNHDIYRPQQMALLHKFLFNPDSLNQKYTVAELLYLTYSTRFYSYTHNEELSHSYSDDYKRYFPDYHLGNQELCLRHLEQLVERAEGQKIEKYDSKDLNFHRLLDTFGRIQAGTFLGSTFWPGVYRECKRLKIELLPHEQSLKTRYCLASFKLHRWKNDSEPFSQYVTLKLGTCLPETCDSVDYKNKYQLIDKLTQFNAREVDKNQATLTDLYCLPEGMLRTQLSQLSTGLICALFIGTIWILILLYSTIRYKRISEDYRREVAKSEGDVELLGLQNGLKIPEVSNQLERLEVRIYKSFSIIENFKLLFQTKKGEKKNDNQSRGQQEGAAGNITIGESIIDLKVIEGLKVLCMSYIITGHVIMILNNTLGNPREMAGFNRASVVVAATNMLPAFSVNSFFTITGILTTYHLFKTKQAANLASVKKWLILVLYRYLRIMPMYAVLIAYSKYLAKYTGEGPFWDYATSSSSNRGRCEQESWLWTLSFGDNFRPPLEQCCPAAWYLANDFQFFVVTPIFLVSLHKSPIMSRKLIKLCIAAGYFLGLISILMTEADDLSSTLRLEPHGFKTYITFLSPSYTQPQNRIPAYLCGILIGYSIYEFEREKLRQLDKLKYHKNEQEHLSKLKESHHQTSKQSGKSLSIYIYSCLSSIIVFSILSFNLQFGKTTSKYLLAFFSSTFHLLFAFTIGLYVLQSAKGEGNQAIKRFLSASFWKPLSRLSLCALLLNVEVIKYFVQTATFPVMADVANHTALNLTCIIFTYLVSIVGYVIFEAPIKELIGILMATILNKSPVASRHQQPKVLHKESKKMI